MPLTTGQITMDSAFGQVLTQLARRSDRILEIGFGSGLGSTQCLIAGMEREQQVLWATEADQQQYAIGWRNISKTFGWKNVNGRGGVLHNLVRPYYHPIGSAAHKAEYDECARITRNTNLLESLRMFIAGPWDLVLLDGGEYSSDTDFLMLWPTTRIFALDDCTEGVATKNVYARKCLLDAGWKVIAENLQDRNGWSCLERPV